ncbi:MAG: WbqC family protein [Lentimicrobiaceae bacterium]|nr:WbqC family protein [Lentimicrobiaceae bacterium]
MKKLPPVVLPFACLPDIEFMSWLLHSSQVFIEVQETYPRQTCRNRYAIMTAAGPSILTIPVKRPGGNHTPFMEVMPDEPARWVNNHWRAIEAAYNNSPFFLYYRDAFEHVFRNIPPTLFELNQRFLEVLLNSLGVHPNYDFTGKYEREYTAPFVDMRTLIMPKQDRSHHFRISEFQPYVQTFSEKMPFAPNLSALDLLFNLGPESLNYLQHHLPGS